MNDISKTIKHFESLQKRYTTQHNGQMCERVADALETLYCFKKSKADSKYNFDNDNRALIDAFAKIGIALRDENGDYRNTCDVLKDMSEKYEQLFEQDNN